MKMKFTKLIKGSAIAMIATIAMVGCGNGAEEEAPIDVVTNTGEGVSIEFWHNMTGAFTDTINEIVEDFNNTVGKEEGIHVEAVYQGSYDDLKAKTMASIKSGNAPEIVQGTVNNIMELIQSGYIQDLTPYIYHDEIGMDYDDIFESYRAEMSSYTETGEIYSLPFAKSTDLLFYNADFFKEHGLSVPTTWDETIEVAKQITEITGKPALSIDNLPNYLITYLMQSGADYTTQDGQVLFNNKTAYEAIKMLKTGIDEGYFRIAGEDKYSSAPFLAENTFMYIGSTAGQGFLNRDNFDWDTALIPQVDVNNPKSPQQGANVAVINQGKTSEEVFASYEFIKYLVSTEVNTKWAMETGYLPIRQSVVDSPTFNEYLATTQGNVKANGIKATQGGFVEAIFAKDSYNSSMVRNDVNAMVEEVILGGRDIQDALDYYASRFQ